MYMYQVKPMHNVTQLYIDINVIPYQRYILLICITKHCQLDYDISKVCLSKLWGYYDDFSAY